MYISIDLKSFYASVECIERGLDPLCTNLVVADPERTEKTICLAVSPALKKYGIPGRTRLFEVIRKVNEENALRKQRITGDFKGTSFDSNKLDADKNLEIAFITAPPRMKYYMEYSTLIYRIYLKYIAPEDIHVYSIDEVFIDASAYVKLYKMTEYELALMIVKEIYKSTGVTAAVGIGTNLYLCKVAMDIVAKHITPDENGIRIARLDEMSYRRLLWKHKPLTDFWRIGRGYAEKLNSIGLYTMGDIARCSLGKQTDFYNEDLLYKMFGVNAEFIIDHAWGYEPCTIKDIKAYKPDEHELCMAQVLPCPYDYGKALTIIKEMAQELAFKLMEKGICTKRLVLTSEYDAENTKRVSSEETIIDRYGRHIPKSAHGTVNLEKWTSLECEISEPLSSLFLSIIDKNMTIRKLSIAAINVKRESEAEVSAGSQMDLFKDFNLSSELSKNTNTDSIRQKRFQQALSDIKKKYGKNAVIRGINLREESTALKRNKMIGGHNE